MHDIRNEEAAPDKAAPAPLKRRGNKRGAPRPSIARDFPGIADDDVLLTAAEVGVFFGGVARPLDLSTIYRHAAQGLVPLPVKVGPRSVRWLRSECRAAREKMTAARPAAAQPTGEGA
jgi:predicted DNA-binding transcriptional regulator AlpA